MAEVEVSLPADLLEEVDREAARRGITREDLVDLALRRELSQPLSESVDLAVERARVAMRVAGPFEAADLVRRDRDR